LTQRLPTVDRWADLSGRRILVRCDFNVPLTREGADGRLIVADDFRLRAAVPLLAGLRDRGADVVVATHLGRPRGADDPATNVAPVRAALLALCPGVTLLENLRSNPGEKANDEEFGRSLVAGVDGYVNEAFGVSHRTHASIMAPPKYVESAAGPNLIREVSTLLSVFKRPARPFIAIVGGVKVVDKLALLRRLVDQADAVLVGGAMAFTFWRAVGRSTGASVVDDEQVSACADLLQSGKVVIPTDVWALPVDSQWGPGNDDNAELPRMFESSIPDGWLGLDIGPSTASHFSDVIRTSKTVLWNGPMGVFEDHRLMSGTKAVAEAIAQCDGTTIVGGGDSASAIKSLGLKHRVSFVSTGGGAALELLEFGDLPGLRALRESPFSEVVACAP
jgi:phosphoglycerate kinase